MASLSVPEATLLAALAGAVMAGFVAPGMKGLGFLLERRITGAVATERLDRGIKTAQLLAMMAAQSDSARDVNQMGTLLRRPEIMASPANTAIINRTAEDEEPRRYGDNNAMRTRAGASYEVAQAQLGQALGDLELLLGPDEAVRLHAVQAHWGAYREALAELTRQQFAGGTHAGLAWVMTALAETERRTAEVREMVAERAGE